MQFRNFQAHTQPENGLLTCKQIHIRSCAPISFKNSVRISLLCLYFFSFPDFFFPSRLIRVILAVNRYWWSLTVNIFYETQLQSNKSKRNGLRVVSRVRFDFTCIGSPSYNFHFPFNARRSPIFQNLAVKLPSFLKGPCSDV